MCVATTARLPFADAKADYALHQKGRVVDGSAYYKEDPVRGRFACSDA